MNEPTKLPFYERREGKGCVSMQLEEIGKKAKSVVPELLALSSDKKNRVLHQVAENLLAQKDFLIAENNLDVKKAE